MGTEVDIVLGLSFRPERLSKTLTSFQDKLFCHSSVRDVYVNLGRIMGLVEYVSMGPEMQVAKNQNQESEGV